MATSLMESSSLPKPTRKATAPTPPAMQQPFPHQPQAQFPYSNQYYYPNYPQQPYPQGYFGQAPDQQQQQFAQWAFQQMMFNSAQQQQLSAMPGVPDFGRQRTGSGAGQEFGGFPPMLPPHLGFQPSGTPPPHPHPQASGHAIHQMQYASVGRAAGTDHQGFHPYRRPGQAATMPPQRSPTGSAGEFGHFQGPYPQAPQGYPQPSRPYAREMNGSATSLHSNGSGSERRRTGSNAGNNTPRPNGTNQRHGRNQSAGSSITAASARPESDRSVTPPARNTTASPVSSSGASPTTGTAPALPNGRTSSGSAASTPTGSTMRPAKPSPLSQQSFAGAADPSKRLSRDDTTLEAPHLGLPKTSGLKGRLRRALSFSAVSTLDDAEEGKEKLGSRRKAIEKANKANAALQKQQHGEQVDSPGAAESIRTTTSKKPSRTASLFNRRLNASTDNISLQSTVSSASVMIRKLGSMGKLARRNSLAGLTGLFKDKKDKGHKAEVSEASVTHATVEVERIGAGSGTVDDMTGLSPAAKLARQHTLRSNAQAAERARLEAQQAAAAAQAAQINRVEEEEEEEEESDDETFEHMQMGGGFDDEDITVRLERTKIAEHDEDEVWAVGIRRSVERTRQPVKGILRNAVNFNQENYLDKENAPSFRQRANSETNPSTQTGPTPLARIPSPDPDHIDGLHRSGSPHETTISTFSAEFGDFTTPSLGLSSDKVSSDKGSFNYTHPALNSSAPVLSSIGNTPLTQRSATAPLRARKLTFAQNLSVYDTFAPSTYDRRSEPATCNRLTPALAQRIKEELNSYKMEEMEVHANSRIHTHFFV